ncbi:MAG: hypothetical protein V4617_03425 [Gemmatimonadota bacterium]
MAIPGATPSSVQGIGRRLAERFALIAFGLYHVPLFLNNYPSLGGGGFNDTGLAVQWGRIFTVPGLWVAQHLFGVASPGGANGDNGDTAEEFARVLLCVVIGIAGAIVWTVADRRRPRAEWTESVLRVLLRYSIVLGLMGYAIAKILPQQFPPLTLPALERRVGDLTPMALLWTFMQFSRPYAFMAGLLELVPIVLLCFRRTALLGALVCLPVMLNVTLMNYAYGVPVKLYATMITLSCIVLILYDAPRLLDLFVRNRPVGASRESTIVQDRVAWHWRAAIKFVVVGSVVVSCVRAMSGTLAGPPPPTSAATGTWQVVPLTPDAPWRRLTIDGAGVLIRTADDVAIRCALDSFPVAGPLSMQCRDGRRGTFDWTRSSDTLRLEGTFDGAPVSFVATWVDRTSYTLMRSEFRWFFD